MLALGVYPEVGLKKARDRHHEARLLLIEGTDPNAARNAEREARIDREKGSFEIVARERHTKQTSAWSPDYADKELRQLTLHVFPRIGARPAGTKSLSIGKSRRRAGSPSIPSRNGASRQLE